MRKPKESTLRKKLWKVCSYYIRARDGGVCFTCGRQSEGSGYHAGHYIPSSVGGIALRYDERNIHGQCYHCNINLGGYGAMYHKKMIEVHGQELVDELWKIKNQNITKWSTEDFLNKIKYYESKIKNIK